MHFPYAVLRVSPVVASSSGAHYVPWNPAYLYKALEVLMGNVGAAFNIGLWIFILITAIYVVFGIVDRFGK